MDANVRRSALTAKMGTVVAIQQGRRQRLLLNRSSIIQIETPPHPSRACQSALQLAYLRLLVITCLTQPLPLLNASITPAPLPQPTPGSVTHYTSPAFVNFQVPPASCYLLVLGAEEPGQFCALGEQGGVGRTLQCRAAVWDGFCQQLHLSWIQLPGQACFLLPGSSRLPP